MIPPAPSMCVCKLCCSQKGAQDLLLLFFAAMGMVEAVRLCLKSGISPGEVCKIEKSCTIQGMPICKSS